MKFVLEDEKYLIRVRFHKKPGDNYHSSISFADSLGCLGRSAMTMDRWAREACASLLVNSREYLNLTIDAKHTDRGRKLQGVRQTR